MSSNVSNNESAGVSRYLAFNMQALRKKKGFSQNQLAQFADIPRSTITNLESGAGNPSLTNLCKLAAALNVSVEELLSRPRNDYTLIKAAEVPVLNKARGMVNVHKLMPDKFKGIEIDKLELQAKSSMGGQPHLQGTKEYLMTQKGTVAVYLAGEAHVVNAGDVFAFPGDQPHSYRNATARPAVAISVVLPVPHLMGK